ncbi:amino acid adenylation domain-containing protein, partial [Brevibacillus borstelensis]|uniref:non-ribosomal peptide synthetase n=3 Tax=Brevibacillus borstelensis TaxID=45462 RepID=UPI000F0746B4
MQYEVIEGYRLSPQQKRVWNLQNMGFVGTNYLVVRLVGELSKEALQSALVRLVNDHEIFRTDLKTYEELLVPVQVVRNDNLYYWNVLDLRALRKEQQRKEIEDLLDIEKSISFKEGDTLLRATLALLEEREAVLVLTTVSYYTDTWTLKTLAETLGSLYSACLTGREEESEIVQYGQYAEWQNEILSEMEDEEKQHWNRLGLLPLPQASLPFAKGRTDTEISAGEETFSWTLSSELVSKVEELAEEASVTPEVVLFAGWQSVLSRLTNQSELVIGFGVDGRAFKELEGALGLYGKYLPIRGGVVGTETFRSILHRLSQRVEHAREWQGTFWIEEWSQSVEESERCERLQFGFDYLNTEVQIKNEGDLEFTILALNSSIDRFDLRLSCLQRRGELNLELRFDSSLYRIDDIRDLASYFNEFLRQAVMRLDDPAVEFDLLDEFKKHQILVEWSMTEAPLTGQPVHKKFEEQVLKTPERVAVLYQDQQLTFMDLNIRANELAHRLIKMGVGADVRVAICVEPSLDLVVGILGVLKAGGAYVPVDPSYPKERIQYMLEDSLATVLLTQKHLADQLSDHAPEMLFLDEVEALIKENDQNPDVIVTSEDLAYIIYTSGSTGRPKGTLIHHGGLTNYLEWAIQAYEAEKGEGAPLHSSIAFDLTVTSLFVPLLAGNKVVLVPQDNSLDGLVTVLREHRKFSFIKLTPAHLKVLSQKLDPTEVRGMFRKMIIGGEALLASDVEFWRKHAPETVLYNEYGPTEAVVGCIVYEIPSTAVLEGTVPIGRPIAGARIYILDENKKPVPVGSPGEIFIGGAGVARGYLNQPALTAERFLENPFFAGDRLYKTGDLARYLPDGTIEYIGRLDDQVKIRGYRIEPIEITKLLDKHPLVRESVVVACEDVPGEKRLVAYVVTKGKTKLSVKELRDFLGSQLPSYMLPSAFVSLEKLPLTSNGKVDKKALPKPDQIRLDTGEVFIASRSEEEEILSGIWAQVLGVDQVGIDDNYFALGGDSIRSIQVVARAQERGIKFSVEDMFRFPTIRSLMHHLRTIEYETSKPKNREPFGMLTEIDRRKIPNGIIDAYPLTLLQEGMIFHSEFSPDTPIYHDITSLHIKAPFHPELLREAIDFVVNRHATLRTSYDLTTFSRPLQLVHEKGVTDLMVDDITHLSFEEQETYVANWLEEEKGRGFDWRQLPLLRFHVHRRSEDSFQFTVSFHHAILDGWSEATMLMEMFRYYLKLVAGEKPQADVLGTLFRDFVELERLAMEECRQYWDEKLQNMSLMKLPRWKKVNEGNLLDPCKRVIYVLEVPIPHEISEGIKKLAVTLAVPLKNVLLAAHMRVLNLLSNQTDLLTCVVSAGRPESPDGERVLGLFINSLPFRMNLEGGTWKELALQAFETEREMLPYRRYPIAEIKRNHGGRLLSETLFYFTHYHVYHGLQELPGVEVLSNYLYEETSFPLASNFFLDPFTNRVHLKLKCDTNVLERDQINLIGQYYLNVLTAMATDPDARYEEADLLTEAERRKMWMEWNNHETKAEVIEDNQTLVRMFEEQVAKHPNNTAVSYEGNTLTYTELNRRANQLAHYLRGLGVGPESLVGLCVDRSLDMIVSILGIQKAGGAYVPLDTSNPKERLAYILQDCAPTVLVTKSNMLDNLPEHLAQTVCLDVQADEIAKMPDINPIPVANADNLAYIIYTSGSTGQPKGVLTTHRNVLRLFSSTNHWFNFNENDVWTVFHSYAFDFSVWEIWGALLYGGKAVVVPLFVARSPEAFYELLVEEKVTVLNQTPSAFRQLMNVEEGREPSSDLSLRYVIFGGEALDIPSLAPWFDRHGDQQPHLINMYGITETTVHVTFRPLTRADLDAPGSVIGLPIPDLKVYLLDAQLNPVPVGVPGEIYVSGAGLARGYLNQEELTRKRFVRNPFHHDASEHLYKSGDLARYLPNGDLEYVGRIDDQVKIRGYRIELGEIQSALSQHGSVRESVVVMREDVPGDKRLVAYVVSTGELTVSDLRQHLANRLPDYMVPSAFVLLKELPMTANGKIDRRALPKPSQDRPDLVSEFVAPRNEVEELIAGTWSSVLGRERVGINDNFFELGGHSLLATQVITLLRDSLQINLPLRALFEAPTVRELAVLVEELRSQGAVYNPMPVISPDLENRYEKFPLTDIQQAYLVGRDKVFELGNSAAHIYMRFESDGLDVERLNKAVQRLIDRHDMLRAIVHPDGQQQILKSVPPYVIKVKDLRGLDKEEIQNQIEEDRRALSHQVFHTDQWPLFEIRANRIDETRYVLHVSIDLLITDADSLGILSRELGVFYSNPEANLPPLEVSFRDYVLGELSFRQSEQYKESLRYWTERLKTLPPAPEMPLISGLESIDKPEFVRYKGSLEEGLWKKLKAQAARIGVTPSGVLLAAYSAVLRRWAKKPQFTINVTTYNCLPFHPQAKDLVGDFTSLTLLGVDSDKRNFEELAKSIQKQFMDDLDHNYVSGIHIMRELARMHGSPLGNLMPVVFTSVLPLHTRDAYGDNPIPADLVEAITQSPQLLIDHQVSEEKGSLHFRWDVLEYVFPEGYIHGMFNAYQKLLHRLALDEKAWLEQTLDLIPAEDVEMQKLANATEGVVTDNQLHTLFAKQVAQRPDQHAVVSSDR